MLGPAFILGIDRLLDLNIWQYLIVALASAVCGLVTGHYIAIAIIFLHLALWYFAHKRQNIWFLGLAATVPAIGMSLFSALSNDYRAYLLALGSAICQLLLYRGLTKATLHRFTLLEQAQNDDQNADRLMTATTGWQQLNQLDLVSTELNTTVEHTYDVYQDMEMLARTNTNPSKDLVQRMFTAAQMTHQNRLRLREWHLAQQQILLTYIGQDKVKLSTACQWVVTQIKRTSEELGRQIEAHIDLPDEAILTVEQQLPMASMLLAICQKGLTTIPTDNVSIYFNGYVAGQGMRLVVTIIPETAESSGEWPQLTACDLGAANEFAERLHATCKHGLTMQGEQIYTIELN